MSRKSKAIVFTMIFLATMLVGCSTRKPESAARKPPSTSYQQPGNKQTRGIGQKMESDVKDRFHRGFIGTWLVEGSTAEFKIELRKGMVIFSGRDREDLEHFEVLSIHWDKSTFQGSFSMPSTNHLTTVKLTVLDENRLHCEYFGDASGEAIWLRE